MNIKVDKIALAILLLFLTGLIIRIASPVVTAATEVLGDVTQSRHSDGIGPAAVLMFAIGAILITFLAALKLILRRNRNNSQNSNGQSQSQSPPRRTKFWHNRNNQGGTY